jgi:CubicO group peptidase (beta-lactamase class C family)
VAQRESRRLTASGIGHLRKAVDADIAAGRCDGVSVRVDIDGSTAFEMCEGFAERRAGRALGVADVFVTMSSGKQFLNVLILAAIERGALSFSTLASELLPCFAGSHWRGMDVAQLLTHTSGVLTEAPAVPPEVLLDTGRLCAFAAAKGPQFAPGSRVGYSTVAAHAVLAEILKVVDGGSRSVADILHSELFEPLGMHDSSLGYRADLMARLCPVVACYEPPGLFDPHGMEAFTQLVSVPGASVPGGGYLSTAPDMHRFVRMLANGGELDGVRILSAPMLALATRNHTGVMQNDLFGPVLSLRGWQPWPACVGLGFFVRGEALTPGPLPNLASPGTFGGWGAGSTAFWCDPVQRVSFSLLSTGLMEDTRHIQRVQRLSDIVLSSLSH